jgi:aspartate/methionine/tyrosine aminotransferase
MGDDRPLFFHVMDYAGSADRDVVDMVSGNPDWEPPETLRRALAEYAEFPVEQFQYPPSEGLGGLREAIAARNDVDVDRVVVTNGAGEANHQAMACGLEAADGEEVVLADPVYPYYSGRTNLLGATPRFVPAADDGTLDPDRLAAAIDDDTAVVVLNSPNNPTGAVYPESTLRAALDLVEDHDAVLVSDEVYEEFDYSGTFTSALSFDSDRVVITSAFSKSMAITGFRVGYGIYPEWLVGTVKTRHMLTNVAGSRPAQHAVLEALEATPPEYYAENRRLMESRIEAFTDALDRTGAEYTTPKGSFYVMARFDGYPGTLENVERLIDEAGVAGMPGDAFGESREEWIRFALVTDRVEEAADRLADYFG